MIHIYTRDELLQQLLWAAPRQFVLLFFLYGAAAKIILFYIFNSTTETLAEKLIMSMEEKKK